MDYRLDKDISTNATRYFFSLLGPRFEVMNELMAVSLSQRFGATYKPIYIFSAHPNKQFVKQNYIVLNKRAERVEHGLGEEVIYLQEYEDMNNEFVRSPFIQKLADQLFEKQKCIPVYSFTTSFLSITDPRWLIIGPSPEIATYYDNKARHYELFEKLSLSRNDARIYKNEEELLKKNHSFPGYITASYTSGGNESGLIYSKEMLDTFLSGLRAVNKNDRFVVARIFEHIVKMPNVNAIVTGKNITKVLVISDQIMRGTRYMGNVYPTSVAPRHVAQIKRIAVKIGNHLSRKGYRGLFGCDFLINKKGKLVVVDLNPRRQGGYACNALALRSIGISLTDLELACALRETPTIDLSYNKIQYPSAWAHSKIKPYDPGQRIVKESKQGNMMRVFSKQHGTYYETFYTKGSIFIDGYIGYVVSAGKKQKNVYDFVVDKAEAILKETLS